MLLAYVYPDEQEWFVVILNIFVFVFGVTGNSLILLSLLRRGRRSRSKTTRTWLTPTPTSTGSSTTMIFLTSLCASDLLRLLVCMPPTLIFYITETWLFGLVLCKLILFLENVFILNTILTLTYVAYERWQILKSPFVVTSSVGGTKLIVLCLWLLSVILAMPEPITLTTVRPALDIDTVLFTQCVPRWSAQVDQLYMTVKALAFFVLPLAFMLFTYTRVLRQLDLLFLRERLGLQPGDGGIDVQQRLIRLERRRHVTRFMIVLTMMYMVTFLPVYLLSVVKYFVVVRDNSLRVSLALLAHFACYANAAFNPVVYCLMSDRFRRDVAASLLVCNSCGKRADNDVDAPSPSPQSPPPYVIVPPSRSSHPGPTATREASNTTADTASTSSTALPCKRLRTPVAPRALSLTPSVQTNHTILSLATSFSNASIERGTTEGPLRASEDRKKEEHQANDDSFNEKCSMEEDVEVRHIDEEEEKKALGKIVTEEPLDIFFQLAPPVCEERELALRPVLDHFQNRLSSNIVSRSMPSLLSASAVTETAITAVILRRENKFRSSKKRLI